MLVASYRCTNVRKQHDRHMPANQKRAFFFSCGHENCKNGLAKLLSLRLSYILFSLVVVVVVVLKLLVNEKSES